MKWILLLVMVFLISNCGNPSKRQASNQENTVKSAYQTDTLVLDSQIKSFKTSYEIVVKELYDSVSRYETDNIDFSDITGGIERKYRECNDELTKKLIGFELAKNYLLHFSSSNKEIFKQKADTLFYSFICYKDGEIASKFLNLDLSKVRFVKTEWENFSDKDKETIMFYGLLRGFDNGLPDVLKNFE